MQVEINGLKVVAGDGSTGYTSNGEWLGVPVIAPVSYVAGDEANNRKISNAMRLALTEAIESNPAVRSSVYVRETGMVNDRDPASDSQNSFVSIASTTFNGNVSVVTQVLPVGSDFVFMQNTYDVNNIVGQSVNLVRVPEDYAQCITTAFDGQQDQGYLITPTAYAQFDAAGRAEVGATAAAHCASNNFKWMALADPGPFLVTDVNEYSNYVPHKAAADLVTGLKYLVDNAIYEWTGAGVSYNKLAYQEIIFGKSAEVAVNESANLVPDSTQVGLLDAAEYTVNAVASAADGVFELSNTQYWPVNLPIQKVTLTGSGVTNDFTNASIKGGAAGVNLLNTEVYVIAPPNNTVTTGEYSLNYVLLATTAADASNIYSAVALLNGSVNVTSANLPNGAVFLPAPSGDTALISYGTPQWDLPVNINGQTSDLTENISGASAGVNTLHLPGTLQDPTETYLLNWVSRTFMDPSAQISPYVGTVVPSGTAAFSCLNHNLVSGQKVYFTKPITVTNGGVTSNLVSQTNKLVANAYWVKVIDINTFALANSLVNYTTSNFMALPTGTLSATPSIFYTEVLGRGETQISSIQLLTLPMVRARKYAFDTSNIWNQALDASVAPSGVTVAGNPNTSVYLNNSSVVLGEDQITPYGEDLSSTTLCGYLPEFNLVDPDPTPTASVGNAYCVPTVDQFFASEAYLVPAIDSILIGTFDGTTAGTVGPATTLSVAGAATVGLAAGMYNNVPVSGGSGTGLTATLTVDGTGSVTAAVVNNGGQGYQTAAGLTLPTAFGANTVGITAINTSYGSVVAISGTYGTQLASLNIVANATGAQLNTQLAALAGSYFNVTAAGFAPSGDAVVIGDRIAVTYNGSSYSWLVIPADTAGGDLTTAAQPAYQGQVELVFTPEQLPPANLWRFDAVTSTEVIDNALRGVGFNGVPQAAFIEAGVDNVNRLLDDSQRYFNPQGFIAYYGPYIENGAGQFIPPSPYVAGVAVRRYRAEGYQFPPAGVKYQLADAVGAQIAINSAQQNLLNPKGCNVVRTLPGYPQTAVFIWGGRTRVNEADAQQRLYQFVNTRVILNVVYGSLRTAFDSQIFNVIDGFGVIFNQIISVGNSVLNQLYVRGALFGTRPSDAFQVICDARINPPEDIENGIVNAKVFVTPVPTLERIQIDLVRVAIGKMQQELDIQGLGQSNQ
jgi:hypothetical protein